MMKALRFHGQKDIRLEDVEVPKCGKGQVMVSRAMSDVSMAGSDQLMFRSNLHMLAYAGQVRSKSDIH